MQIYRMGLCTGKIYDDEKEEKALECCRFIKADSLEDAEEISRQEYNSDYCRDGCNKEEVCPEGLKEGVGQIL